MHLVEKVVRVPLRAEIRDTRLRDLEGPAIHEQEPRELAERGIGGILPRVGAKAEALAHVPCCHFLPLAEKGEGGPCVHAESVQVVESTPAPHQRVQRRHQGAMDERHPFGDDVHLDAACLAQQAIGQGDAARQRRLVRIRAREGLIEAGQRQALGRSVAQREPDLREESFRGARGRDGPPRIDPERGILFSLERVEALSCLAHVSIRPATRAATSRGSSRAATQAWPRPGPVDGARSRRIPPS